MAKEERAGGRVGSARRVGRVVRARVRDWPWCVGDDVSMRMDGVGKVRGWTYG